MISFQSRGLSRVFSNITVLVEIKVVLPQLNAEQMEVVRKVKGER